MAKRKIIFRVDGSSAVGLGHISRCCALADMLKNNFDIYFYTRATSSDIFTEIKNYCIDVFTLSDNISYDDEACQWISILNGNEIVILDGYNFNTNYQQQIKEQGCTLVCIDDIHSYHFVADVVLNHAPDIHVQQYSAELYTKFYLGTDYVLLKKVFLQEALITNKSFDTKQSCILICLGGSDPNNITIEVLEEIILLFPNNKINVVVGAAYTYLDQLKEFIKNNKLIFLHINIKPVEILYLMKQSHIAITSASTIALEYICVKGNLFLKQIADNQESLYRSLIEKACAFSYELLKYNYASRKNINNQYDFIDGKSNRRLLEIFNNF